MNGLPDPTKSRAVLIGTSRFAKLSPLPAVRKNLAALAESLCDDRIWGLPPSHCVIVEDPITLSDMLDPILEAARDTKDTLVVYYAGHGLIDPKRGELHLTLIGSDPERIYTAVSYSHVRDQLLDSRATRRIVVMDCCYSGRALGLMGHDLASAVADDVSAEGTYIMAAAAENKPALAPLGEEYTAFTAELLATLRYGIPGHGEMLDLDKIFNQIRDAMRAKSRPVPQKRDRNTAGQLTLIRNRAYRKLDDAAFENEESWNWRTLAIASTRSLLDHSAPRVEVYLEQIAVSPGEHLLKTEFPGRWKLPEDGEMKLQVQARVSVVNLMSDRTVHVKVKGLCDTAMRADAEVLLAPSDKQSYFLTATFTLTQWADNWGAHQAGEPAPHTAEGCVITGERNEGVVDTWPLPLAAWPIRPTDDSEDAWQLTPGADSDWFEIPIRPLRERSYWISQRRLPEP